MYKSLMFKLSQLSRFFMVDGRKSCFRSSERKVVAALKSRAVSKDKSLPGFLTAGRIASIYVHT